METNVSLRPVCPVIPPIMPAVVGTRHSVLSATMAMSVLAALVMGIAEAIPRNVSPEVARPVIPTMARAAVGIRHSVITASAVSRVWIVTIVMIPMPVSVRQASVSAVSSVATRAVVAIHRSVLRSAIALTAWGAPKTLTVGHRALTNVSTKAAWRVIRPITMGVLLRHLSVSTGAIAALDVVTMGTVMAMPNVWQMPVKSVTQRIMADVAETRPSVWRVPMATAVLVAPMTMIVTT